MIDERGPFEEPEITPKTGALAVGLLVLAMALFMVGMFACHQLRLQKPAEAPTDTHYNPPVVTTPDVTPDRPEPQPPPPPPTKASKRVTPVFPRDSQFSGRQEW